MSQDTTEHGIEVTPFDELTEEQKKARLNLAAALGTDLMEDAE